MVGKKMCLGAVAVLLAVAGCGGKSPAGGTGANSGGSGIGGGALAGTTGGSIGLGTAGDGASNAGTGAAAAGTTGSTAGTTGAGGAAGTGVNTDALKTMFPAVTDWAAIEIVYPTAYSAFDGVHTFKLPFRARCTPQPLANWHADPATAVSFDADPDNANGVMVTIVEPVAEITIAVVNGTMGGTAPLHITMGTPEQWTMGETRYHTGADWMLNIVDPKAPPPDTKCTTCHGANSASGFDVQHTPTQAARISDDGLMQIMTTGTKPADVPFRVIPDTIMFGATTYTNAQLYMMFHLWQATPDQLKGMILYLRSLTPTGQGCVTNPSTGKCEDVMGDPTLECKK